MSSTKAGSHGQMTFTGTEKPAVAVAERFLLLPSTYAAKEMPTGESGVVTLTKRMFLGAAAAAPSLMYGPLRLTANSTLPRGKLTPVLLKLYLFIALTARSAASVMPAAPPFSPETPANAAASAAFCSSFFERYNLLISIPKPTASSTANIPTAEVARIEPRSRFLFSACSTGLLFMFPPHISNEDRLEKMSASVTRDESSPG